MRDLQIEENSKATKKKEREGLTASPTMLQHKGNLSLLCRRRYRPVYKWYFLDARTIYLALHHGLFPLLSFALKSRVY